MAQASGADFKRILRDIADILLSDLFQVIQVFAHHGGYQFDSRQIFNQVLSDEMAVPEDRDPVADRIDLFQEMRDKDNSHALVSESPHQNKELFDLLVVKRRSRLIQNQDLAVHIDSPCDRNHLLDRKRIVFKILCHIDRDPEIIHDLLRPRIVASAVDRTQSCQRLSADKQILRHRKVRAEIDFLVNSGNTDALCVLGRMIFYGAIDPGDADLPCLEVVDAGKTLDQGRLACPVFSHKGMDLTPAKCKVNVFQSSHTGKCHGDASGHQYNIFLHTSAPLPELELL